MSEKQNNNTTELVFILDRSGSMAGLESDTIGGFNSMMTKQKKEEGQCYVSTVLFNQQSVVLHDRVPLEDVRPLTDADYIPGGCTALLDALGDAMHHIRNVHKYARAEDVPAKTMFVIITDGYENASHRYTAEGIRGEIENAKRDRDWEFVFLGANIDAVETAHRYGIQKDRAANFVCDDRGTEVVYDTLSVAVSQVRASGTLGEDWSAGIDEDFATRK